MPCRLPPPVRCERTFPASWCGMARSRLRAVPVGMAKIRLNKGIRRMRCSGTGSFGATCHAPRAAHGGALSRARGLLVGALYFLGLAGMVLAQGMGAWDAAPGLHHYLCASSQGDTDGESLPACQAALARRCRGPVVAIPGRGGRTSARFSARSISSNVIAGGGKTGSVTGHAVVSLGAGERGVVKQLRQVAVFGLVNRLPFAPGEQRHRFSGLGTHWRFPFRNKTTRTSRSRFGHSVSLVMATASR